MKRQITFTPSPSHPFSECTSRALIVLCGLTLSPRELTMALDPDGADADPRAGLGEAMRLVVERIRTDADAAARLDRALELRLWGAAARFIGWTIGEIAEFWSRERASLSSAEAAAILWVLGRDSGPLRRTLETRIADDIEIFALQALSRHAVAEAGSNDASPAAPFSVRRAVRRESLSPAPWSHGPLESTGQRHGSRTSPELLDLGRPSGPQRQPLARAPRLQQTPRGLRR